MNANTILAIAACVLIILDAIDTYMIIHHGKGREANPTMSWVIGKVGLVPGLLSTHGLVIAVLSIEYRAMPTWSTGLIAAFYLALLVNNLRVWRK